MQETLVQSLGQKDLRSRKWQPALVFLPGKCQEQRSLVGYSPQDHKESDMTEQSHLLNKLPCLFFSGGSDGK